MGPNDVACAHKGVPSRDPDGWASQWHLISYFQRSPVSTVVLRHFLQNNVPCILWKWVCRPSIVGYGSYYRRSKARPSSITSFMTSSPTNYTTRGGSNNGTWIILFVVEVLEMKHFLQARLLQKNRTSLVIATWLCLLFEGIQSLFSPLLGDWSGLRMIWRQRGHLPFLWLCKRGNIDNDMYDNMMKRCYDAKCIMSNVLWWRCIKFKINDHAFIWRSLESNSLFHLKDFRVLSPLLSDFLSEFVFILKEFEVLTPLLGDWSCLHTKVFKIFFAFVTLKDAISELHLQNLRGIFNLLVHWDEGGDKQ